VFYSFTHFGTTTVSQSYKINVLKKWKTF
jgi:hypothetical protein